MSYPFHLKTGALTAEAKAAGMSLDAYISAVQANPKKYSKLTHERVQFALNARHFNHKGQKS